MKTRDWSVFALCACLAGATLAQETAQQTISEDGAASINADMQACAPETSASKLMEECFEEFKNERGIAAYGVPNANGTVYFYGKATVTANVTSPNFIKSRTFAYEKAKSQAIATMVMNLTGTEMTRTIHEYFSDESDNRLTPPKDFEEAKSTISRKTEALTEAMLDKGLEKLGADPNKYKGDVAKKRTLFKDSLLKRAVRKAVHQSSGFLPVQTFETRSSKGVYNVGVVLRTDADCKEIATSLSMKRRPKISKPSGLTIDQALPSNEELLTQFGVRLYFDETGLPSLLSFGQFGSSYTGDNERRQERALEHAFMQAESLANQQLTDFINSTVSLHEESEMGEAEVEEVSFDQDGTARDESVTNIIDKISKRSDTVGRDTMIGRSKVKTVTLQHPAGHKVACVILRWSFGQLEAAQSILSGRKPRAVTAPEPAKKEDSGKRKGRVYDF